MTAALPGSRCTTAAGLSIEYTAAWESLPLIGADGLPDATISATTYLAAPDQARRPVMFLFNGGPGASSSPLHLNAFGPRIFTPADDGRRTLVANPDTLLDLADLVFIDPVGTGFNRELRPGGQASYLTVEADATAVERYIRHWLQAHGRTDSPVYAAGQSYGGFRLATLCKLMTDLPVAGLVFISPMLDASATTVAVGNDLPHVFDLPTMATAAWFHGRTHSGAPDAAAVFEAADAFARNDYLRALYQGHALSDGERRVIAERVGDLLGLPVGQVLAAGLRIDSEEFLRSLLADKDLLVGRLDTRVTGPMPPPAQDGRPDAADDPSLGAGRSNVIESADIADYLREQAGAKVEGAYVSLSLETNFRFDWRASQPARQFYTNPTSHIADLMRSRPQARTVMLGGYFDLATPLAAVRHAVAHAGIPAHRVSVLPLAAGHSLDTATRPVAASAVRGLILDR